MRRSSRPKKIPQGVGASSSICPTQTIKIRGPHTVCSSRIQYAAPAYCMRSSNLVCSACSLYAPPAYCIRQKKRLCQTASKTAYHMQNFNKPADAFCILHQKDLRSHTVCGTRIQYAGPAYCMRDCIQYAGPAYCMRDCIQDAVCKMRRGHSQFTGLGSIGAGVFHFRLFCFWGL